VKYLKGGKVKKAPFTKNSYVLYATQLRKSENGVWVLMKVMSRSGSDKCQP
jgi:hypothetical protein